MSTTQLDIEQERRKFIRHPVSVPLNIEPNGERVQRAEQCSGCPADSRDVSLGGLLIHSEQPLPQGSRITITFPPLFDHAEEQFHGTVIRVERDISGGYNIGINFSDQREKMRIRMVEQILRIESYRKTHRIESFDLAAAEWIQKYSDHFPRF